MERSAGPVWKYITYAIYVQEERCLIYILYMLVRWSEIYYTWRYSAWCGRAGVTWRLDRRCMAYTSYKYRKRVENVQPSTFLDKQAYMYWVHTFPPKSNKDHLLSRPCVKFRMSLHILVSWGQEGLSTLPVMVSGSFWADWYGGGDRWSSKGNKLPHMP